MGRPIEERPTLAAFDERGSSKSAQIFGLSFCQQVVFLSSSISSSTSWNFFSMSSSVGLSVSRSRDEFSSGLVDITATRVDLDPGHGNRSCDGLILTLTYIFLCQGQGDPVPVVSPVCLGAWCRSSSNMAPPRIQH